MNEAYFTGVFVGLLIAWPVWRLLQVIAYLLYVAYDNLTFQVALWRLRWEDHSDGPVREEQAQRKPRHRKM